MVALNLSVEKTYSFTDAEMRINMFRQLLRIRKVEEAISQRYKEQQMRCPVHLCVGQEAIAVGVCANLTEKDYALSTHRAHSHYLAKGGNLDAFVAELYGKSTGCCGGRGGSMHLIDLEAGFLGCVPIVASSIPIAVGAAFEIKRKGLNSVAVAFFGEASTEEGVFYESLNFSHFHNLTILYICENNLYSVETPYEQRRHPSVNLVDIIKGFKIEASSHDGQDLDIVYGESKKAIEKIRGGHGPQFVEFRTQRLVEHCGPKVQIAENPSSHLHGPERDPVRIYQERLIEEELSSNLEFAQFEEEFNQEIENAFTKAKQAPYPSREELFKHIYFMGGK